MQIKLFYKASVDGFSLLELVFIIMLIGILSIIIVPRWSVPSLNIEFEARRVLNDIRYAQALSMTSGQRYHWMRLSNNTYSINNEMGTAIVLPGGSSIASLSAGIQFGSFSNLPGNLIAFDSLGTPYVTAIYPGTPLASPASISLMANGASRSIQMTPETGYGMLI